jgi:hypothetical protein
VRAAARFLAAGLVLLLAACATPNASITFDDPENPGRVTGVTGLKSRDAAHAASQAAYYDAQVNRPQRLVMQIKAHEGQQVTISGLKEFSVYAPSADADALAPAQLAPNELAEGLRAAGQLAKDVGSVVIPFKALDASADVLKQAATPTVVNAPPPLVVRPEVVNPLIVRP